MTQPPHPAPLEPTCDVDQVAALISEAAGADTAAIEALEAVVAALRRAQTARTQVPTEVLRQALLRQGGATS
jgi:hypothetical protein